MADFGRYAGLGLQFAATLVLFGALGWWLDSSLGSKPWCLVAGIFAGNVFASVALVRAVSRTRTDHDATGKPASAPRTEPQPPKPPSR